MIGWGMRSPPILKFSSDRSVCAPQYRSAGTSIGPKVSVSVRVDVMIFLYFMPRLLAWAGLWKRAQKGGMTKPQKIPEIKNTRGTKTSAAISSVI
jgi:hypothetical protein